MAVVIQTGYAALVESLESLDEVIHQKVRLGIMSALMARGDADFRFLKETLSVTDGNLSIHLSRSWKKLGMCRARKSLSAKSRIRPMRRRKRAGRRSMRI